MASKGVIKTRKLAVRPAAYQGCRSGGVGPEPIRTDEIAHECFGKLLCGVFTEAPRFTALFGNSTSYEHTILNGASCIYVKYRSPLWGYGNGALADTRQANKGKS